MENTYSEALALVKAERIRKDALVVASRALQNEFTSVVLERWKQSPVRRKRKITLDNATLYLPEYDTILNEYRNRAKTMSIEDDAAETEYKTTLAKLAEHAVVPAGTELIHVEYVYGGAYRSQGYGSHKYAHAAAEGYANLARRHGLTAEIECGELDTHYVRVNCTKDDWAIIRAKPGLTLKEWLVSCLKNGINPRVLNPYLPHGLEEKFGIDHFGNEVMK